MDNPDQLLADSIMSGNAQSAQMALNRGADPNLSFGAKRGDSALVVAIDFGHEELARVLFDAGARGDGALHAAIGSSSRGFVDYLLSRKTWSEDELGAAMVCAAMEGLGWEMSKMLDCGAPIEWRSKGMDMTALGWATQGLDTEDLVHELLRRGADPCAKVSGGKNIWEVAREQLMFHSDGLVEAAALSKRERDEMDQSIAKAPPMRLRGL